MVPIPPERTGRLATACGHLVLVATTVLCLHACEQLLSWFLCLHPDLLLHGPSLAAFTFCKQD